MSSSPVTRVLIVGGGAVGLIFGGCLSKLPNVEVSLYARSNYELIKANGAFIKRPDVEELSFVFNPAETLQASSTEPYEGEPFDYVVIASKSLGTEALTGLDKFCDPNRTMMILFQNGVDIAQPYLKLYPGITLSSAVVRVAAALTDVAEATFFAGKMTVEVGLEYADSANLPFFKKSLVHFNEISNEANVESVITENITKSRWEKMLWNGTFNTLCAITDLATDGLFKSGMEPMVRQLMQEIWNVGETIVGDDWVSPSKVDSYVEYTKDKIPAGFLPSTLQDVRRGTQIEIEAIVGNTIRAAEAHNVPVPTIRVVYALLNGVNYRLKLKSHAL